VTRLRGDGKPGFTEYIDTPSADKVNYVNRWVLIDGES
jgi:hypothetical protein